MYPRITIQSGISAGTTHPITSRVARIGSDPKSDVCLPTAEIPAHALTLEFRDSSCLVYNRCRSHIIVGAQVVDPDQSVAWPETDILQLAGGIELLLDFDEQPDSGLSFEYEDEFDEDTEQSPETRKDVSELTGSAQKGSSSKTIVQLAVTAICVVGCVLLLLRDQTRARPAVQTSLQEILDLNATGSAEDQGMIRRLQYAETMKVRGRKKLARQEFKHLRDELLEEVENSVGQENEFHAKVMNFVQLRLAK